MLKASNGWTHDHQAHPTSSVVTCARLKAVVKEAPLKSQAR